MGSIQMIRTDSGEELVVLSRADYDALVSRADEEDNVIRQVVAETSQHVAFPEAVWERIEGGVHPIKAIREFRGFSQEALAAAAGLPLATIILLESGRANSVETIASVAKALAVSADDLAA